MLGRPLLTGIALLSACTPAELVFVLRDSGAAPTDAATPAPADVGNPLTDVGNPVADVGNPVTDVGNPVADVGNPLTDVGNPLTDVGSPPRDVPSPRDVAIADVPVAPVDAGWFPERCSAVQRGNAAAGDGEYTLYVNADPARPWRAWCRMRPTPAEYLPLVMRGDGANFSLHAAGGARVGTTVRTAYARVRVDPVTLRVDIGDQTFATSTGRVTFNGRALGSVPYGVAMDCIAPGSAAGRGNIDLRGTPFAVASRAFVTDGFMSAGDATYSPDQRVVTLRGGGYCGWTAPRDAPYDPGNVTESFSLPLLYLGI